MKAQPGWRVRLAAAAEADFAAISAWTTEVFGEARSRRYQETLVAAIEALMEGPQATPLARPRDEIAPGLYTLHVGLGKARARHILLFRWIETAREAQILRILHDSMDLKRHLPGDER